MTDFHRRLIGAYHEAIEASHHSDLVTIHVGQDVWRWMEERSAIVDNSLDPTVSTFAGFPIVQELSWATEQIEVHTRKVIP